MDVGNFINPDSIDEGIQVVDRNGVTVFYNRVAANLDNLKPEEYWVAVLEVFLHSA